MGRLSQPSVALLSFECRRYLRNARFWVVSLILVLLAVGTATGTGLAPLGDSTETLLGPNVVLGAFQSHVFVVGGLAACFVGYSSINEDQRSGQLRTVLKLPYSRRSVFVQKVVGRSIAVVTVTTVAVLVGVAVTIPLFGLPELGVIVGFLTVCGLYQTALVVVSSAVSVVLPTGRQAIATVTGLFLVGWLFGRSVAAGVAAALMQKPVDLLATEPSQGLTLYLALERLPPMDAFLVLTNWLFDAGNASTDVQGVARELQPTVDTPVVVVSSVYDTVPLVLSEWMALGIVLGWTALGLVVGVVYFERGEIK